MVKGKYYWKVNRYIESITRIGDDLDRPKKNPAAYETAVMHLLDTTQAFPGENNTRKHLKTK